MGLKEAEKYLCPDQTNITCSKQFDSFAANFILYIIYITAIILATFGNLVVIIIIAHFKQLHTPTNVLTLSMAVADFLFGIFVMPVNLVKIMDTCWYFGNVICVGSTFSHIALTAVSVTHLIFLSLDRYCAVCHPLLYSTKITLHTAWIFVAVSWNFSICYSTFQIYLLVTYFYSEGNFCVGFCFFIIYLTIIIVALLFAFFLPFSVMLVFYSRILVVAIRHAKAIRRIKHEGDTVQKNKRFIEGQNKATITIGIVISIYFLCLSPLYYYHLFSIITGKSSLMVRNTLEQLSFFHFSFNPLIYGLFYPWFRKGFKLIVTFKVFQPDSSLINLFSENK